KRRMVEPSRLHRRHELADAHRAFADSAQAYEDLGSLPGIGTSLMGLAAVTAEEGYPREALMIASAAERLSEEEGVVVTYAEDSPGRLSTTGEN
ncbi:MAG: hypothetical protein ACE5F5_13190, partial [Acidimicrobiia bacterium]